MHIIKSTDYPAIYFQGIAGVYVCTNPEGLQSVIRSVEPPEQDAPEDPAEREAWRDSYHPHMAELRNVTCRRIVLPPNGWWKKKEGFGCPICKTKYTRSGNNGSAPGYAVILYGPHMETWFIPAEPPHGKPEVKLGLLRTVFMEGAMLSLIHDKLSFNNFWEALNGEAGRQFREIARFSTTLYFQVMMPPWDWRDTPGSLSDHALGQDIPAILMPEHRVAPKVFRQQDWEDLVDSIFLYYDDTRLPPVTWYGVSNAQQTILYEYAGRSQYRRGWEPQWNHTRLMREISERAKAHPMPAPTHDFDWRTMYNAAIASSMQEMRDKISKQLPCLPCGAWPSWRRDAQQRSTASSSDNSSERTGGGSERSGEGRSSRGRNNRGRR